MTRQRPVKPRRKQRCRPGVAPAPLDLGGPKPLGVCSNPFGCMHAAEPWRFQTALEKKQCRACTCTPVEEGVALRPASEFQERPGACPVCLWLFGTQSDGEVQLCTDFNNFLVLEAVKAALEEDGPAFADADNCWMCGFIPARVLGDLRAHGRDGEGTLQRSFQMLRALLRSNAESVRGLDGDDMVREWFGVGSTVRQSNWEDMRRMLAHWIGTDTGTVAPYALNDALRRLREREGF